MIDTAFAILAMMPVFLLGTMGELISQKSGVYNIGIEGVMAFGGISALLCQGFLSTNPLISLGVGFLGGALFGIINSFLSIRLRLNQVIAGYCLWFVGVGIAGFVNATLLPGVRPVVTFPRILRSLDMVFFVSLAVWLVIWVVMSKSRFGLRVRAVGESPKAADVAGIDVFRIRWICVTLGCGLIGCAGSYLFTDIVQGFRSMVTGYGWVCFALVMFARWKVPYVLLGAAIFTAINGIQTRLQVAGVIFLPTQFMNVLPYVAVIIGLVITKATGGKGAMPSSLDIPYQRE